MLMFNAEATMIMVVHIAVIIHNLISIIAFTTSSVVFHATDKNQTTCSEFRESCRGRNSQYLYPPPLQSLYTIAKYSSNP